MNLPTLIKVGKVSFDLARYNLGFKSMSLSRAYIFGPGTDCRCATCTSLPVTCGWGKGPYVGTVLLYAQVQ
jgi:hypothetical protein